jgi:hypothetical protein
MGGGQGDEEVVGVRVGVAVAVGVFVAVDVLVAVGVFVAVDVLVAVAEPVGVAVLVAVGVLVAVDVLVCVGVFVCVGVLVAVPVLVGVSVGVGVSGGGGGPCIVAAVAEGRPMNHAIRRARLRTAQPVSLPSIPRGFLMRPASSWPCCLNTCQYELFYQKTARIATLATFQHRAIAFHKFLHEVLSSTVSFGFRPSPPRGRGAP